MFFPDYLTRLPTITLSLERGLEFPARHSRRIDPVRIWLFDVPQPVERGLQTINGPPTNRYQQVSRSDWIGAELFHMIRLG